VSQPEEHQNTTSAAPQADPSTSEQATPPTSAYPSAEYSGPPTHQGPPAVDVHPPQYGGQSEYPAAANYPAPGYPAPYPAPGYPANMPAGAPYGYPPYGYSAPRGPGRPGGATASAVLMFIQAAVVLISTFYVLFFASLAGGADAYGGSGTSSLESEWTIIGILQLVSVGLLIFAGVQLLGGNRNARTLTIVACGAQLVLVVYWMVRIGSLPDFETGTTFFFVVPLMYAVLPVVALPLGMGRQVSDYIAARSGGPQMRTTG